MVRQVQPLRISKAGGGTTPSSTPNKNNVVATSRPLSEIGSTERRRNSPSYNQATRKMIVSREASPYTENSSPPSFLNKPSPRDFWSTKDPMSPSRFDTENANTEQRSPSPATSSPRRRPSVERLAQASRVKNSNIFALESKDAYDPTTLPIVERPIANRPFSQSLASNNFARFDSAKKENNPYQSPHRASGHKRTGSEINIPTLTPTKSAASVPLPSSPEKQGSPSPTKSSLARTSLFGASSPHQSVFDPEHGVWSDDEEARTSTPRALHRHAKSVTFHEEPPVVNEYEQQTPEPSVSAASDREGSWDSEDFDDPDYSFDRGSSADGHIERDDSFDADLENADKTPVVLPEDWSRMSPDEARTDLVDDNDDVFEDEAEPTVHGVPTRIASDGSDSRPLPPLPAFLAEARERRGSDSLTAATERAAQLTPHRQLPSPPKRASCSKDDILKMVGKSSLSLQDRLELLESSGRESGARPDSKSSTSTALEHERDLQLAEEQHEELTITNLDTGEKVNVTEKEVSTQEDDSLLDDLPAPPKISRESILRKVRNSKYNFEPEDEGIDEYDESEIHHSPPRPSIQELAQWGPDDPVPSRENSRETSDTYQPYGSDRIAAAHVEKHAVEREVVIKPEPVDDDAAFDMNSIPPAAPRSPSRMEDYDENDDSQSRYSSVEAPDAESTMIHNAREDTVEDGKETLQDSMALLSVKDYGQAHSSATQGGGSGEFMGLPAYLSAVDDYDWGMGEYLTSGATFNPYQDNSSAERGLPVQQEPADMKRKVDVLEDAPLLQPTAAPLTPPEQVYEEPAISPPGTPDSVIHHNDEAQPVSPLEPDAPNDDRFFSAQEAEPEQPLPEVPERIASIKTGGKLKARPSITPADAAAMAEQRRIVSNGDDLVPDVPAIPGSFLDDTTANHVNGEEERATSSSSAEQDFVSGATAEKSEAFAKKRKSRKSGGRMDLSLDTSSFSIGGEGEDASGLGLENEFERVIEGQKVGFPDYTHSFLSPLSSPRVAEQGQRVFVEPAMARGPSPFSPHRSAGADLYYPRTQKGYLMRQNTKVVVATNRNVSGESNGTAKQDDTPMSPTTDTAAGTSSRGTKSANSSPRKASAEQFLKTEPWNGKTRRQSIRNASAQKSAYKPEPAPPLPGQESALGVVEEDYSTLDDDVGEGVERGRLFVKVVGVKDLDLPMPRNDRTYFQLTLDNGLHCVTTSSLELGTNAPIGQEFELVVLNDLEFQLTLTTKLPPPPKEQVEPRMSIPSSPSKSLKSQKSTAFSRFLSSPKKRAEKERQEREAAEAEEKRMQEEARRKRASIQPTAWDLLHELVNAADGSFARAYINLKSHEQSCFGRQLTVDVPCYNEWALEQDASVVNSVRSKRGTSYSAPIRRPPYVVGQLELQLLYVPKPKGATDEDMPKSMSAAVREMKKAAEMKEWVHEGHLSQQGGDCKHWRRRFFRLQGPKLTAYHEHTHQKRAVINLSKASRLVDDKSMLVADPAASPSKKNRRKSAFAEEDEGYAYVEEGFRIRFANGETIDFYADNKARKDEWMGALSQVIGKSDPGSKAATWTDLILARERAQAGIRPDSSGSANVKEHNEPEVKDFGRPSMQQPQQRMHSYDRKPVMPPRHTSKSAPTSPAKSPAKGPLPRSAAPAPPPAQPARPRTPPMNPRRGHRSRDAVKSMIF